jgi:hypothetical protein
MESEVSLPYSQKPSTSPYQAQGSVKYFVTHSYFIESGYAPYAKPPKLESHPLSAVRVYSFSIFLATFMSGGLLHPQKDALCRGEK